MTEQNGRCALTNGYHHHDDHDGHNSHANSHHLKCHINERFGTFANFGTNAIHAGHDIDQWPYREVVPPICLSTTFKQAIPAEPEKYDYIRAGNATRDVLEKCLAKLENAKTCHLFASGLSATCAITGFLKQGDHVLSCDDVYGGSQRLYRKVLDRGGIQFDMVDTTEPEKFAKALQPHTRLVWIESPSNPLLKVTDIAKICQLVKQHNPDVKVVVDNTFMSPFFQRPLDLGADVVLHSITKYINGHSDVLMGCVCTSDDAIAKHLTFYQLAVGALPSPFDCYLVNRGVKTLHLRMRKHMENALAVAKFLERHPKVDRVLYPELPNHPQHAIHRKQTKGMSGMVSFYLKGDLKQAKKFFTFLKYFILAESLGGYESLAEHPATMTHASVPYEDRQKLGISDNLIRLSVGLEEEADLLADLAHALSKCDS